MIDELATGIMTQDCGTCEVAAAASPEREVASENPHTFLRLLSELSVSVAGFLSERQETRVYRVVLTDQPGIIYFTTHLNHNTNTSRFPGPEPTCEGISLRS